MQAFPEENAAVQLQLVTAAVKLFLKSPQPRAQQMIQLVLTYATQVCADSATPSSDSGQSASLQCHAAPLPDSPISGVPVDALLREHVACHRMVVCFADHSHHRHACADHSHHRHTWQALKCCKSTRHACCPQPCRTPTFGMHGEP